MSEGFLGRWARRKEAVRKALEEFGDAAGLASQFTTLSKKRRRRLLMRATLATSAVAGLVFLAVFLFGPSNPDGPPQQVFVHVGRRIGPAAEQKQVVAHPDLREQLPPPRAARCEIDAAIQRADHDPSLLFPAAGFSLDDTDDR